MYTIPLLPFLVMYASRNIIISSVNVKKKLSLVIAKAHSFVLTSFIYGTFKNQKNNT